MPKSEIENLKFLLLKPEREKIQQLTDELNRLRKGLTEKKLLISALKPIIAPLLQEKINDSPEDITTILAPIMGRAIEKQVEISQEEVVRALSPIIGFAIQKRISEAQDEIVDALYPVIGQTIRKSITEAMKKLAQAVNEKVDNALSFQILKMKFKSRISGIPQAQLALKDALPFKVNEIFYIHRETGLLLTHISDHQKSRPADQEIISGMLTAIKDFASSAFSEDDKREVNEIQYDDMQIYLEAGRYAYLAVVVSGIPPKDFKQHLSELENSLHKSHDKVLRSFDGNTDHFKNLQVRLKQFTNKFNREIIEPGKTPVPKSGHRGLVYLFGIFFLLFILLWSIFYLPDQIQYYRIKSKISSLVEHNPLNTVKQFSWKWRDNTLLLEGIVSTQSEKDEVSKYLISQLTENKIENRIRILPSETDLHELNQKLVTELGSKMKTDLSGIQLITDEDKLILKGNVFSSSEKAIIIQAVARNSNASIILSELICPEDLRQWKEMLQQDIEKITLYYSEGKIQFLAADTIKLNFIASALKIFDQYQLNIEGYSDNTGDNSQNLKISGLRAETVQKYLINHGILPQKIVITGHGDDSPAASNDSPEGRALNRRVNFLLLKEK